MIIFKKKEKRNHEENNKTKLPKSIKGTRKR